MLNVADEPVALASPREPRPFYCRVARSVACVFALILAGCAQKHVTHGLEAAPRASRPESAAPEKVLESAPRSNTVETAKSPDVANDEAPDQGVAASNRAADPSPAGADNERATVPEPAEVEGDVFAHCAYGPPNYGESPATDAKEPLAVVVLDKPLPEVCPEPGESCVKHVTMFHVSTLSDTGAAYPKSLEGRRIRFKVSEFARADTGHHHSRVMLWYRGVNDLGPASHPSLRSLWPQVKDDFLGISCKGYPR